MTIREFYDRTGGDYEEVMSRFFAEERIARFLRMFPEDPSFEGVSVVFPESEEEGDASAEVSAEDIKKAFRSVHTLKGICLNLGLARLYRSASAVNEALRAEDAPQARTLVPALRRDYREVVDSVRQIG